MGSVFRKAVYFEKDFFAPLIPTFSLATSKSRKVLPCPSDASYNLSQLGLSISALAPRSAVDRHATIALSALQISIDR